MSVRPLPKGKEVPFPSLPSENLQPLSSDDVFIAVMGVTGSGKTTFISKLCSSAAADIGHGLQSASRNITSYSFMLDERKVHLIDTPGFDDTFRSDADVLTELAVWLSAYYQQNLKLDGILYLHRITDMRMTGSSMKNLRIFKKLCGSKSLSSIALVTTMWDTLVDYEMGNARQTELVSNSNFWGTMTEGGSVTFRHSGTYESALQIVSHVVSNKTTTVLQIQKELVDEEKTLLETSAGQELIAELEIRKKNYKEDLRTLEVELKKAISQRDAKLCEEVVRERDISEVRIKQLEMERHDLQYNQATKLLSEKRREMKELNARYREEQSRLEAELAEKEIKIQSLQEAYEQTLVSEASPRPGSQRVNSTELDLLAEIERERKEWRIEREELQKQLDPQLLLQVMLVQLGLSIREYQTEAPPPYASEKPSRYENLRQASENDDSSVAMYPETLPSLAKKSTVNCHKLVRPHRSKLRHIYALWKKFRRPETPNNYRRVEWICECGDDLYADLENTDPQVIDEIERLLKSDDLGAFETPPEDSPSSAGSPSSPNSPSQVSAHATPPSSLISVPVITTDGATPSSNSANANSSGVSIAQRPPSTIKIVPKYLALCVNTGSMYKTLVEFDILDGTSDAEVFYMLKDAYVNLRGLRALYGFLMKPVDVHFVHFRLWHLREGYVSVHDKPTCIPPPERRDYEYDPRPLIPRQPFPPEALLHYLNHKDTEFLSRKRVWTPRLPKRLGKKVIQGEVATEGWGIHIVEGPNRNVIFWVIMSTTFGGILAMILWSLLKKDIQGGTGLGAVVLALPAVILTAFLFKLNGI